MDKCEKIKNIIDSQARALVGTLMKRVEVLAQENALSASLYKSLAKELVYENSRQTKALVKMNFDISRLEFKTKSKEK